MRLCYLFKHSWSIGQKWLILVKTSIIHIMVWFVTRSKSMKTSSMCVCVSFKTHCLRRGGRLMKGFFSKSNVQTINALKNQRIYWIYTSKTLLRIRNVLLRSSLLGELQVVFLPVFPMNFFHCHLFYLFIFLVVVIYM